MQLVKRLVLRKSDHGLVQFLRYGMVAAIGLAVDFGGLILLTERAHFHYLIAATVSFLVALVVNYFLSIWWVFPASRFSRRQEFAMFGLIGLVGLGLNDGLIWVLTEKAGIYYVGSKALAAVLVYFWNFFARKAIFAMKPQADEERATGEILTD